jgi:Putative DNA-binding domain
MPARLESWEKVESQFARALLRPGQTPPRQIVGSGARSIQRRYNVYRNNVTVKLVDALTATFPAVERITGTQFFRTMATFYVRESVPHSPLLFEYGHTFPDFVARYEHAQEMPWLADTARIERAWLDSYHAADAEPFEKHHLQAIPPTGLAELRLVAHPAMRIVRSPHPAFTIFCMNRGAATASAIEDVRPEDTLVTRPGLEVRVTRLDPGQAEFLLSLASGVALGAAVEESLNTHPAFDLPTAIATAITSGAFMSTSGGSES